jgi:hypothetical protein
VDKQVVVAVLSLAGVVVGVIGKIWTEKIRAKATENAARYSNPNYRPEPAAGAGPGKTAPQSGSRWVWWAVIGFFGFVFVANLNQPAFPPQPMGFFCCDGFGVRRCQLVAPMPLGQPCGCPGQGMGVVCP